MNIRFSASLCLLLSALCPLLASFGPEYSPKQKMILFLNSLEGQAWQSTAPNMQPDPNFAFRQTLNVQPGFPASALFFVRHAPGVAALKDCINIDSFKNTDLHDFAQLAERTVIHEHTAGACMGQIWCQDNVEASWQWWVGAQERNFWLSKDDREAFVQKLQAYTAAPTKQESLSAHAPQPLQHRLTMWHAAHTTLGVGDVHINFLYRMPLHARFSVALGAQASVPLGKGSSRLSPHMGQDNPPLEGEGQELAMSIINRARDILLTTPLGSNGHLGLGFVCQAQVQLARSLLLKGDYSHMYYRSGIEDRCALSSSTVINALEEGMPKSAEGVSSDAAVWDHLKHKLYPVDIKSVVTPGAVRTASVALCLHGQPIQANVSYVFVGKGAEYSETAPLATLTRRVFEQHAVNGTLGLGRRYQWGESSSYVQASYVFAGTGKGGFSVGFGLSVQA